MTNLILIIIAAFAGAMIGYSLSYIDHYKRGYEDGVKTKLHTTREYE